MEIKYGYVKLNTRYIPKYINPRPVNPDEKTDYPNVFIHSSVPINLQMGPTNKCVLKEGTYFLPFSKYHQIKAHRTTEESRIYCGEICDENYIDALNIAENYVTVISDVFSEEFPGDFCIMKGGMFGFTSKKVEQYLEETAPSAFSPNVHCPWLNMHKGYESFCDINAKGIKPVYKSYREICDDISSFNKKIEKYEQLGILTFVAVNTFCFDETQYYNYIESHPYVINVYSV